ncbi:MAG: LysR family transcriptional regulator [SAR202 cluster bacterium]|nr:LysR family transcriptional regulator [SAR202 cluster bacterium]
MDITNFHQLYIFHTVASMGSFSGAARSLSLSQPAVSIQVRELEKSLGSPLFYRTRRGPMLTDIGRAVHEYTQRIFALADEMHQKVHDIQGLAGGRLTIGSSSTAGEQILPWVIGKFQKIYPDVDVSVSISNTEDVLTKIRNREMDLGMAGASVDIEGLASFPYVEDEIVFVSAPSHHLAAMESVPVAALLSERFVMREVGSATRRIAAQCLAEMQLPVKISVELGGNEAVKRAVQAGLGLGMVSRFSAAPDIQAGLLTRLQVEGWACKRSLYVFYRMDRHLPAAQQAFLTFLQQEHPLPPS